MRILFDLQYYQNFKVDGTSLYHTIADVIRGLPDGHFCYVMLPRKGPDCGPWEYDAAKDFDAGRVKILEATPFGSSKNRAGGRMSAGYSDEERKWLEVSKLPWYYDVVVTTRQFSVYQLREALERGQKGMYRPGVVMFTIDASIESKAKDGYYEDFTAQAELYNMLLADANLFHCTEDKAGVAFQSAPRWAAPSSRARLMDGAVLGVPIDFQPILDMQADFDQMRVSRHKPRLGYFNSFWPAKRPKEYERIANMLYRLRGVETTVTSMAPELEGYFQGKNFDCHLGLGREEYRPYLGQADVVLALSAHETTGRSYWEALVAGNVVIFKRERWLKDVLPYWYPYQADSIDEVQKMALWVFDNLAKAREEAAHLAQAVMENYSHRLCADRLLAACAKAQVAPALLVNGTSMELLDKVIKEMDWQTFTLDQVAQATAKYTKNTKPLFPSQFLTRQRAAKMLQKLGYEDLYCTPVPVFRRVK